MSRCPCCDAEIARLDVVEAFTLGAGLAEMHGDLVTLRESMCTRHRIAHVVSMATLRAKVDAIYATPEPSKAEESRR